MKRNTYIEPRSSLEQLSTNQKCLRAGHWGKMWESEDGRGNVQKMHTTAGTIYDAWLDGTYLGQSRRMAEAKQMVLDKLEVTG